MLLLVDHIVDESDIYEEHTKPFERDYMLTYTLLQISFMILITENLLNS